MAIGLFGGTPSARYLGNHVPIAGRRRSVGGDPAPSPVAAPKTKGTKTVALAGRHTQFFPSSAMSILRQDFSTFRNLLCSPRTCVHAVLQTQTQPARLIKMSMSNQTHNDEHVQPDLTVVHVVLHHGMFTLRMACPAL